MAVLFSAVTLTADNNQVEFLAAGVPRDADDLEGWTAYENFVDELDSEQEVSVHVEAYLYGEGETFKATPRKWRISRCERMQTKNSCTTTATTLRTRTSPSIGRRMSCTEWSWSYDSRKERPQAAPDQEPCRPQAAYQARNRAGGNGAPIPSRYRRPHPCGDKGADQRLLFQDQGSVGS